mgnify:CR=1 FL=1
MKYELTDMDILITLTPFIHQQWRRLRVSWFDPRWEQFSLVSFIPQILIEVGISNLLKRINVIYRHKVTVQVHKLYTDLKCVGGMLN